MQKIGRESFDVNEVILVGRLTKDPELKSTLSGVSVCSFTVACDRRYQKEGERQADFISCVAWRNTAEFISKYFPKGTRIALEGSLQTRSWEDDAGNKRYATEVVVDHAEFCESSKSSDFANDSNARIAQEKEQNANFDWKQSTAHQSKGEGTQSGSNVQQRDNTLSGNIDGFIPTDFEEDLPFEI